MFFFQKVGAGKSLFIYVFWILGGMVKLHGNYILDEMYTQVIYTKAGDHDRQRCRERRVDKQYINTYVYTYIYIYVQ